MRVLKTVEFDNCDSIFWRTDGNFAPITFLAIVNDTFGTSCADCEEITPENIGIFEQSFRDCRAAAGTMGELWAPALFAARVRQRRPIRLAYPEKEFIKDDAQRQAIWALLDAAAPNVTP